MSNFIYEIATGAMVRLGHSSPFFMYKSILNKNKEENGEANHIKTYEDKLNTEEENGKVYLSQLSPKTLISRTNKIGINKIN